MFFSEFSVFLSDIQGTSDTKKKRNVYTEKHKRAPPPKTLYETVKKYKYTIQ